MYVVDMTDKLRRSVKQTLYRRVKNSLLAFQKLISKFETIVLNFEIIIPNFGIIVSKFEFYFIDAFVQFFSRVYVVL